MRSVVTFVREWFREWWALMGCAAFTFLGIYVAGLNKSNAWIIGSSAALGTIFFFVASYRVWKRQNNARIMAETELNKSAKILRRSPEPGSPAIPVQVKARLGARR
jgi:hypothetical protein